MNFDIKKMLASKRALRRDLSARPVAEKLRMLDAMRERELAIRGSVVVAAECLATQGQISQPVVEFTAQPMKIQDGDGSLA